MTAYPLLEVLHAAARGDFPPADGRAIFVSPPGDGLEAVVSFTGHAVLATALPESSFEDLALDGFGAALQPQTLVRLSGPRGIVGLIDALLVARGVGGGLLPERTDLDDHPRVRHARALRRHVRVHGDDRGLITMGEGLAGRLELSVELLAQRASAGVGRALILEGLRLAPVGAPVFAAVSPGNARSLRAFLATGFQPIGSEVVVRPDRAVPAAAGTRADPPTDHGDSA